MSGYWQIYLSEEDWAKCALITSEGLFQPTRMPQGLCDAPATFQRAMDHIMGDIKLSCVLVYLDDVNIFSKTFTKHLQHLREVFTKISNSGLKLKLFKCSFFKSKLEILGHEVSCTSIHPKPAKVEAITNMHPPESLQDVQVFLGMVGYYRQFMKDFAKKAEPFIMLLRDNIPFQWDLEQQQGFEEPKKTLAMAPILRYHDYNKLFILHCDVSQYALGVVLSQLDDILIDHHVAFICCTLNKHEKNYMVTKKECLAVLFGIKLFRPFIHGTHFEVVTDHHFLRWLQQLKDPEGRLACWSLKLQAFDFKIIHHAGVNTKMLMVYQGCL